MDKFEGKHHHKKIDSKTKQDANRTFEKGYIEHINLDVYLVSSNTKQVMGRPWISLLIDEYSKGILVSYWSLEPPSYKSLEMTLEKCIENHSRLPNEIIVEQSNLVSGRGIGDLVNKYNFNMKFMPKNNLDNKINIELLFKSINEKLPTKNKCSLKKQN